jgi:hypothetical protein
MSNSHASVKNSPGIWRLALWLTREKFRLFFRRHLSGLLALVLAGLTMRQEGPKFAHWPPTIELSVALLALGTLIAAAWELWGDKLELSREQQRFLAAMRMLLAGIEGISYEGNKEADLDKRLQIFVDAFLTVSSNTLSERKQVEAVMMLNNPSVDELVVSWVSEGAKGLQHLRIPRRDLGTESVGILYIPNTRWKTGFLFNAGPSIFEIERTIRVPWASAGGLKGFRSVLCLPVAVHNKENEARLYGVVGYFSDRTASFLSEEIFIAVCFANILSEAFATAAREDSELRRKEVEGAGLSEGRRRPGVIPNKAAGLRTSQVILFLLVWLLRSRRS